MLGQNDLKYYIISDNTQKYKEINNKIIKFTKLYFYTMKNHSYQITQIENKLNEYSIKDEVKIKLLLENQQNIIKELIKIINDIFQENRNIDIKKNEKKIKIDYFPLKQKNIIMNTNLHIIAQPNNFITKSNYLKNNIKENIINTNDNQKDKRKNEKIRYNLTKSVDDKINTKKLSNQKKIIALNVLAPKNGNEFKGPLSCLNVKSSKQKSKKEIFEKFVNKEILKKETKPLTKKVFKSMSSSEISNNQKIINNNNIYLKTNNISNMNPYYINNNYTIDEEKNDNIGQNTFINERHNSLGSSNLNENYGDLPHILTKRKKRIKYRIGGKILLTDNDNIDKKMKRGKSVKEISLKSDFYLNYNSSFPNFNVTNSSVDKNSDFSYNRSNSALCLFNGNLNNIMRENNKAIKKIDNEVYSMPYINNGKRIIPTRITKEVLNGSYKILNKYKHNINIKNFKNY